MSTVSDHESQSASNSSADTTSGSGAIGSTGYGSPRSIWQKKERGGDD